MAKKHARYLANILWLFGMGVFLVALGSTTGYLLQITPFFILAAIVILFALFLIPYYRDTSFRRWVSTIGLRRLTRFHVWRVLAAFIFFTYLRNGELPQQFVYFAGFGDLIVGFLAALAVALPFSVMRLSVFHAIGLLDLIVAVVVGVTLFYRGVQGMESIMTLPASLLVLLGVPMFGAVHIYALDLLQKGRTKG